MTPEDEARIEATIRDEQAQIELERADGNHDLAEGLERHVAELEALLARSRAARAEDAASDDA